MKMTKTLGAALAAIFLLAAVGLAQEAGVRRERPRRQRPDRAEMDKRMQERLVKALELSAEQQKQLQQVFDTHKQAVANWQKEHGEEAKSLREQMRKARSDRDREAMTALREKSQALYKTRAELQKSLNEQIAGILTAEQKEKFKKMLAARRPRLGAPAGPLGAITRLDLSDEQKAQVKKIMEAANEDAKKVDDREGKRKIIQAAIEKIKNTVLTDEQKARLAEIRKRGGPAGRRRPFAGLELTEDQKAKVKEIMDAALKAAKDAKDRQARREILRTARQKIQTDVLTEDQRAKAKQLREERMKRFRQRGRGRRRDRPETEK